MEVLVLGYLVKYWVFGVRDLLQCLVILLKQRDSSTCRVS